MAMQTARHTPSPILLNMVSPRIHLALLLLGGEMILR
jgi:hypothetical protein